MSTAVPESSIPPTIRSSSWSVQLPSWLLSLCMHALILLLLVRWLEWSQQTPVGLTEEFGREVGLVLKSPRVADSASTLPSTTDDTDSQDIPSEAPSEPVNVTSATPPVPVAAPTSSAVQTIGAGPQPRAIGSDAPSTPSVLTESGGTPAPKAVIGDAVPGASFMGAQDKGSRIVFVIDCSGSMANGNAMRVAKAELVASLEQLDSGQQFQIVFYNEKTRLMMGRNRSDRPELLFATDINKRLARQYISSIPPEGGTIHVPALKQALDLGPEVIFFLTDAKEPQLTSKELADLERRNGGRTRIHAIEFGKDSLLQNLDNFLKKLARQNGGTYRYQDIAKFSDR